MVREDRSVGSGIYCAERINQVHPSRSFSDGPYLCRRECRDIATPSGPSTSGTGHVGATLAQGINIKANNAVAFAANFRF